ncbi:MAG TPA: alkaline phosphatase family protein [Blastocatellia bacterium]|nr:alkaline phosphatase family protein [Blastocatellia bacterium]
MRILVIGLDAATMELIEPWTAAGHLPALAGMMSEGASTPLLSTPNMHSASAWTSILTGLNPGRHGLFVFSDRDFATGEQVFFKGGDREGELISSHLARHGLTSGFLNVPMTYPAESPPGGFMASGLDAPSLNERAFAPGELRDELLGRFPRYRFSPDGLGDLMRARRLDDAAQEWMKLIEIQTAAAEYLIRARPVDFFMAVFTATDWAGHNLWKFAGTSGRNPLLEIYRALDNSIARLSSCAGNATQVYVISDHGMGRHTGASYHLAGWLERNAYMVRTNGPNARDSILGAARRAARDLLPVSVKERVKAGLGEARVGRLRAAEKDSFYSSIDWGRTLAYTEPGRHVININLEGRNAHGVVKAPDYEDLCTRIVSDLTKWTDSSGTAVIKSVVRRDEVYTGPFAGRASDLYVNWNPEANLGDPPPEVQARGFWWSGDHRPEGVLICKGPGIRRNVRLATPRVYDLVPTIMYGAGVPVPRGLDGRVIQDAFTQEFLAEHPLRIDPSGSERVASTVDLTADEERLIEEKLRSLGYL